MPRDGVRQRALCEARDLLGGASELVQAFDVRHADLQRWLEGREAIPAWVFLRAIDLLNNVKRTGKERPAK